MKCYCIFNHLDSNRITMAIKNQLKVEMWREKSVPTVTENEIKEKKVESKENVKKEEKKSVKSFFKKKK